MQLNDPIDAFLTKHKLPKNRETYLEFAFQGVPPDDLGAEFEASLPDYAKKSEDGEAPLSGAKVRRLKDDEPSS